MPTKTKAFGTGKREGHDASAFYARGLATPDWSDDRTVEEVAGRNSIGCSNTHRSK